MISFLLRSCLKHFSKLYKNLGSILFNPGSKRIWFAIAFILSLSGKISQKNKTFVPTSYHTLFLCEVSKQVFILGIETA
jgi:hypothetical protein